MMVNMVENGLNMYRIIVEGYGVGVPVWCIAVPGVCGLLWSVRCGSIGLCTDVELRYTFGN